MKKNTILSATKNYILIYISLIALFVVSMFLSYAIPNNKIESHISESSYTIQNEGLYPRPFFNTTSSQLDNFTDSLMLNISLNAKNSAPLSSSMENNFENIDGLNKVDTLVQAVSGDYETKPYSRYWHGYQTLLRPLLYFFNFTEIRFINMCFMFVLFSLAASLIKSNLGLRYMISFVISLLCAMIFIAPMSLQFSSIFYITLISTIFILQFYDKLISNKIMLYIFFIIGSLTSFFDLLTFPLMTLGIPLIITLLLLCKSKIINIFKCVSYIFNTSIIWGLGYGLTWASKWIIASIILRKNVIIDAINSIFFRVGATNTEQYSFTKAEILKLNWSSIFNSFTYKLILLFLFIWIIISIFYRVSYKKILSFTPVLIPALFPFIWYIILSNHSGIHYWYTYKILSITIFSVISFLLLCIDKNLGTQ